MPNGAVDGIEMGPPRSDEEYEVWYDRGLSNYRRSEWSEAYECFQQAEILVLNKIGLYLKARNNLEAATEYFKQAQKVKRRPFRLAPPGTHWIRNFFVITGLIAAISGIASFLLFPAIQAVIPLLIFLFDLIVILILFPIAIMKGVTRRKKSWGELEYKADMIEKQIQVAQNNANLTDFQRFIQVEKLRAKRARLAAEMVRYAYTDDIQSGK